jgi:hypothetical protein
MFLTSRAISFLTHVTLGSYNAHRARKIAQISSAEWEDELYVVWGGDGYVTNVKGKVAKRMNSKPTTWEDLVASTIFVAGAAFPRQRLESWGSWANGCTSGCT